MDSMIAASDTQIKYAQTVSTRIILGVLFASQASTVLIASALQFSFDVSDDILQSMESRGRNDDIQALRWKTTKQQNVLNIGMYEDECERD